MEIQSKKFPQIGNSDSVRRSSYCRSQLEGRAGGRGNPRFYGIPEEEEKDAHFAASQPKAKTAVKHSLSLRLKMLRELPDMMSKKYGFFYPFPLIRIWI